MDADRFKILRRSLCTPGSRRRAASEVSSRTDELPVIFHGPRVFGQPALKADVMKRHIGRGEERQGVKIELSVESCVPDRPPGGVSRALAAFHGPHEHVWL